MAQKHDTSMEFLPYSPGDKLPALRENHVHILTVDVRNTVQRCPALQGSLTKDEQQKADSFRFAEDRDRFVAARGLLRKVLGTYLGTSAEHVLLRTTANGKPELDACHSSTSPIRFNVSHSGNVALLALTLGRSVGVDVEQMRDIREINQLVKLFFSANERQQYKSLPHAERLTAFYRCWTGKESFVKAIGEGLSHSLESFDIAYMPGTSPCILSVRDNDLPSASRWHLEIRTPIPGYIGACTLCP